MHTRAADEMTTALHKRHLSTSAVHSGTSEKKNITLAEKVFLKSDPQRHFANNENVKHYENFVDQVECNISRNSDITQDSHVNVSWLSTAALEAGIILADMLPHSEVFVIIMSISSEAWFHQNATIKEGISPGWNEMLICVFNLEQHSGFYIILFWTRSLCLTLELLRKSLCGHRTKIFGNPGVWSVKLVSFPDVICTRLRWWSVNSFDEHHCLLFFLWQTVKNGQGEPRSA